MMNDLLESALGYAARGWRVFPLKPRGKTPLVKTGFKAATVAPAQIRAWWDRWPDANIGIATGQMSGILVLDVDGPEGVASLHRVKQKYGGPEGLPATLVCATGRGFHIYYAIPPGLAIRCTTGSKESDDEGLDVRADGGYVVAPPSIHETGTIYKWVQACF